MTDSELQAMVAAVKAVLGEQALTLQAQIASIRQDLDDERTKNVERRLLESESHQRTMAKLADAVADAIRPHLAELKRRTGELEQRAMQTAPQLCQLADLQQLSEGAP